MRGRKIVTSTICDHLLVIVTSVVVWDCGNRFMTRLWYDHLLVIVVEPDDDDDDDCSPTPRVGFFTALLSPQARGGKIVVIAFNPRMACFCDEFRKTTGPTVTPAALSIPS